MRSTDLGGQRSAYVEVIYAGHAPLRSEVAPPSLSPEFRFNVSLNVRSYDDVCSVLLYDRSSATRTSLGGATISGAMIALARNPYSRWLQLIAINEGGECPGGEVRIKLRYSPLSEAGASVGRHFVSLFLKSLTPS